MDAKILSTTMTVIKTSFQSQGMKWRAEVSVADYVKYKIHVVYSYGRTREKAIINAMSKASDKTVLLNMLYNKKQKDV